MKLNELTVHGFRAFPPEEQSFEFDGQNVVIEGDNGTGKSSVLAAIEFLVCGNLSHLGGPGTRDIRVSSHAPHQMADPEDCYVEGEFVTEDGQVGTVRRTADDSTNLSEISGEIDADSIDVSQWNDDHLILTRTQLTDFIESSPGDRGDELSSLLNLNGIQNRATGFNRAKSHVGDQYQTKKDRCERLIGDIGSALELELVFPLDQDDRNRILDRINDKLETLGTDQIESLDELSSALDAVDLEPSGEVQDSFYQDSTLRRVNDLSSEVSTRRETISQDLSSLSENIEEIQALETESLQELELFETAEGIITRETTECPLCGERHDEGYLHDRIAERQEHLSEIKELREQAEELRTNLSNEVEGLHSQVTELLHRFEQGLERGDHDSVADEVRNLNSLAEELTELSETLEDPIIEQDEQGRLEVRETNPDRLIPQWDSGTTSLNTIEGYMESLEARDELSDAHADLVRTLDALEDLDEDKDKVDEFNALRNELDTVTDLYSEARRTVLNDLYESIEEEFNQYYTTIHPDEDDIDLDLDFEGTDSVELEATHETERDSPLAYHSEGHIDTMGLCLFLALRQELGSLEVDIVMLDDVVMSVDKNHRRGVVRLLNEQFRGETQAVLATHDEVWADQLEKQGVIPRQNRISITNWDISTGPIFNEGKWGIVEEKLENDEPHAAAAHMRRTAEKVGHQAASRLSAPIEHSDYFELSDYIYGVSNRLKGHFKSAKRELEDGSETHEVAIEIDNERSDVMGEPQFNELNSMVHYNRDAWGQLSAEDLRDVMEHWKGIEDYLRCSECGSLLKYSRDGGWRWIQCDCRDIQIGYES